MIPHVPSAVERHPVYRPLLDVLDSVLMTSGELAKHWRFSEDHLSNLRRAGKGPPFLRLVTGSVRYRVKDILESELAGTRGPLTVDDVCLALSACAALTLEQRAAAIDHIRAAFKRGKA